MRKIKKKRPKLKGALITPIFVVSSKDPLYSDFEVQLFAERGKAMVNGVPTLMNGTRVRYRPVMRDAHQQPLSSVHNPWRSLIVTKQLPDKVRKLDLHQIITDYEKRQR